MTILRVILVSALDTSVNLWNVVCMWYFYVLQSLRDKNWFYKGSTNDLSRRIEQHNSGEVFSSCPYKPYRLVYYEAYLYEFAARIRENSVKKNGNISTPLLRRIRESLNKNSES